MNRGLAAASSASLRAWATVFVLLLLVTLAFIDRMSISLMVDPIKASFGINDFRIGLLQGPAFAIFFLIGSLPMGWIVDRFSARWTIYIGVTIWSLATIACGLAGSFVDLLIARCLVGLGEAALQPASWCLVSRLFPPHRLALAISVLSAGAQIGAAMSYVLGGVLIAQATAIASRPLPILGDVESWQVVFLACGLPGLAMASLIFAAPKDRTAQTPLARPPRDEELHKRQPPVPSLSLHRFFAALRHDLRRGRLAADIVDA